jgi:hypothetical protein
MCLEMVPSWCGAGKLRELWDCGVGQVN